MKFAVGSSLAVGIVIGAVADHCLDRVAAVLRPQQPAAHLSEFAVGLNHIKSRSAFFQQSQSEAAVVMLGDLITEYGGDWSELLAMPALNRGIAYDTAEDMLLRLDEVIERKPRIVAVMVGVNDLRSGVPVDLVAARIEKSLTKLKAANVQPVMQSTLLTAEQLGELSTNVAITSLNRTLSQWCTSQGIPFLDLNASLAPEGTLDAKMTFDGIHLTDAGYLRWRDTLDPLLRHLLNS